MKKKNIIFKNAIVFAIITLIFSLFLNFIYQITRKPIIKQKYMKKHNCYIKIFHNMYYSKKIILKYNKQLSKYLINNKYNMQVINEIVKINNKNKKMLGYIFNITTYEGYGGNITFLIGFKNNGNINGIEILNSNETVGLGMKANDDNFKKQFKNKSNKKFKIINIKSKKYNKINVISGATITSKAITNGVNFALCAFNYIKNKN